MFTNEFTSNASYTTVLDDAGEYTDVQLIVNGNGDVCFRQFDDDIDDYNSIYLSGNMFQQLLTAIHKGEGAFVTR